MSLTQSEIDYQQEYRRAQKKLADMSKLVQQKELETKKAQVMAKLMEERSKRGGTSVGLARDRELADELSTLKAHNAALQDRHQRQQDRVRAIEAEYGHRPRSFTRAGAAPRPISSNYGGKQTRAPAAAAASRPAPASPPSASVFSAPARPPASASASASEQPSSSSLQRPASASAAAVSPALAGGFSGSRGVSLLSELPRPTVTASPAAPDGVGTASAGVTRREAWGAPSPQPQQQQQQPPHYYPDPPPQQSYQWPTSQPGSVAGSMPGSARSAALQPNERQLLDDLSATLRARLAVSAVPPQPQSDPYTAALAPSHAAAAAAAATPGLASHRGINLTAPGGATAPPAPAALSFASGGVTFGANNAHGGGGGGFGGGLGGGSSSVGGLLGLYQDDDVAALRRDVKEKKAAVAILQAQFDQLLAAARAEKEVQAQALRQCEEYKALLQDSRKKHLEMQRQVQTLELSAEQVSHYQALLQESQAERATLEDRVRLLTSNLFAGDALEQARVKKLIAEHAERDAAARTEAAELRAETLRLKDTLAARAQQLEVRTREHGAASAELAATRAKLDEASKKLASAQGQLLLLANDSGIDFDRLKEALDVVKRQDAQRKAAGGSATATTRGISLTGGALVAPAAEEDSAPVLRRQLQQQEARLRETLTDLDTERGLRRLAEAAAATQEQRAAALDAQVKALRFAAATAAVAAPPLPSQAPQSTHGKEFSAGSRGVSLMPAPVAAAAAPPLPLPLRLASHSLRPTSVSAPDGVVTTDGDGSLSAHSRGRLGPGAAHANANTNAAGADAGAGAGVNAGADAANAAAAANHSGAGNGNGGGETARSFAAPSAGADADEDLDSIFDFDECRSVLDVDDYYRGDSHSHADAAIAGAGADAGAAAAEEDINALQPAGNMLAFRLIGAQIDPSWPAVARLSNPSQLLTLATLSLQDFEPMASPPAGGLEPRYAVTTQYRIDADGTFPAVLASASVSVALHQHRGGVHTVPLASAEVPLRALLSTAPSGGPRTLAELFAPARARPVTGTASLVDAETGRRSGCITFEMRLLYPVYRLPAHASPADYIARPPRHSLSLAPGTTLQQLQHQQHAGHNQGQGGVSSQPATTRGIMDFASVSAVPSASLAAGGPFADSLPYGGGGGVSAPAPAPVVPVSTRPPASASAWASLQSLPPLARMRAELLRTPVALLGALRRIRIDFSVRALHVPDRTALDSLRDAVTATADDMAAGALAAPGAMEVWLRSAPERLVVHFASARHGPSRGAVARAYADFVTDVSGGAETALVEAGAGAGAALTAGDTRRYVMVLDTPHSELEPGDALVCTLYLPTLGDGDGASKSVSTGPVAAPGLVEIGAVHVPLTVLAAAARGGGGREEGELPLTTARAFVSAAAPVRGEVLVTYSAALVAAPAV